VRPYALAAGIYLGSRLLVLLAVQFAATYVPLAYPDFWRAGPTWYDHLLRWDSEWYAGIARDGYHFTTSYGPEFQAVVFYPFYPFTARFAAALFGIGLPEALLLVANAAGFIAVLLLFKLVREVRDERAALLTVACLSFFPPSMFLTAGYTEPLALLFIVSFFLMLRREHYVMAALFAGLAIATRSTGIILTPVLLWELWRRYREDRLRLVGYAVPCALIATSGLWLFMIYLWADFGNPLAFADAQAGFHDGTSLVTRLVSALELKPFAHLRFDDLSPLGFDQWLFLLLIALSVFGWRRLPPSMTFYSLGVLMLPYLTLSGGPAGFASTGRFGLLAFPSFIILADLLQPRVWLAAVVFGFGGALLFMYSALFSQWYWIG
jgi:hypothetical protein